MINKISNYCKQHVLQCVTVAVSLVMAFGFYATHYTYNTDMLVEEYYNGTVLIGAGRFSAPLINYFTNWMQFAPFWSTVILGVILFIAGLMFGLLFKEASLNKISDNSIFVFWLIFSTFPIISYQLTYPVLSVTLPYILVAISMWLVLPLFDCKKIKISNLLLSVVLLSVSIDMYESFAPVFLTLFFAVMLIKHLYANNRNENNIRKLIVTSVKFISILLLAIVVERVVSKFVCYAFCGTFEYWYDGNTLMAWSNDSVIDVIKWIIRELIAKYIIAGVSNYNIFIFDVAVLAGMILITIMSIKRRSAIITFLYIGTAVSSISLTFILGQAPLYRMCQALPVFVAFFVLLIAENIPAKKVIKSTAIVVLGILILNQTLFINRYTVLNYERHQYETNILQNIAKDLESYSVENKEILFITSPDMKTLQLEGSQLFFDNPITNIYKKIAYKVFDALIPKTTFKRINARYGERVDYDLLSSANIDRFFNIDYKTPPYYAFNKNTNSSQYTPEIYRAFETLGYNYIISDVSVSDSDIYSKYQETYQEMPAYPSEGYIIEKDDMIIVKVYG